MSRRKLESNKKPKERNVDKQSYSLNKGFVVAAQCAASAGLARHNFAWFFCWFVVGAGLVPARGEEEI